MLINNQRHLVQPANDSVSAWFLVYFKSGTLEPPPTVAWPSGETIIAHFPNQLVIDQIACEQVIPIADEFIPLTMKVRNAGRGHYTQQNTKFFIVTGTNPLPSKFVPHFAPGEEAILRWRWKSPPEPKTIEMYTPFPGRLANPNSKPIRVNHRGNRSHCKTIECESILSPAKTVTNTPASMDETAATGSNLAFGLLSRR